MRHIFLGLLLVLSFSAQSKTILFLGDSLTEGHQLNREEAYPYLVEKELQKKHPEVKVVNAGVSGDTTAGGLKRLNWVLKGKPEIVIVALGANDGLRGLKIVETEKNLSSIIEKSQSSGAKVILAGMKMPTNYGESYRSQFEGMYPKLAKKYKLRLLPFLLEGVGGKPELNLPDGIHPNPKGHEIMAKSMLKILEGEI